MKLKLSLHASIQIDKSDLTCFSVIDKQIDSYFRANNIYIYIYMFLSVSKRTISTGLKKSNFSCIEIIYEYEKTFIYLSRLIYL